MHYLRTRYDRIQNKVPKLILIDMIGTELITEGGRPGALYQIVKGSCNIQVKAGDGQSRTMVIASRKEGGILDRGYH